MRPLLTLFLLCTVFSGAAQNFEFGANGGTVLYHSIADQVAHADNSKNTLPTANARLYLNKKKWQFGVSFDYRSFAEIFRSRFSLNYDPSAPSYPIPMYSFDTVRYLTNNKTLSVLAFRVVNCHSFQFYFGFSAGYGISTTRTYGVEEITNSSASHYAYTTSQSCYQANMIGGCTWYMTKHLGFNTEVGKYLCWTASDLKYGTIQQQYEVCFPVTFGLRYRL
jgi:hypothetical protein